MPNHPSPADDRLLAVVSKALPNADAETVAIVSACAGLLATVARADDDFSAVEANKARELLETVSGLGAEGASAVTEALLTDALELASVHRTRFCRTLGELGDRDLRLHVLGLLIELAAADDTISPGEVATLRNATQALGLDQADYNQLQSKHRHRLSSLK